MISRRDLITGNSDPEPGFARAHVLRPASFESSATNGVIWAALTDDAGTLLVAGDDGFVARCVDEQWVQEDFPSDLPVHALTLVTSGEASSRIVAVGWMGLICERRDDGWRHVQGGKRPHSPTDSNRTDLPLFDVATGEDGVVWAVGDQGRVVCNGGEEWHEIDVGVNANLRSVLALANGDLLVGGADGTFLQYCAGEWKTVETGTRCHILGMAEITPGTVIAVGSGYEPESMGFRGEVFAWKDGQWDTVSVNAELPRLRRVRAFGDSVIIVGDGGCAYRWTGRDFNTFNTRLRHDLHDATALENGRVALFGDAGTVLIETDEIDDHGTSSVSNESAWVPMDTADLPARCTLRGIWAFDDDEIIAVGDDGTILHIDWSGRTPVCRSMPAPSDARLYGVWGTTPRNVLAVAESSTIWRFDGDAWSIAHQGDVDVALLAITGFGPHDVIAVGDHGYALRFDGIRWHQMDTGTRDELYQVWGHDSQHVLAVGGQGAILRWNGESWKSFPGVSERDLFGVWGRSVDELYLVGLSGSIVHFRGRAFHKEFSGVRTDLYAVHGTPDGQLFSAGSCGTLLRYDGETWVSESSPRETAIHALTATENAVYCVGVDGLVMRRRLTT